MDAGKEFLWIQLALGNRCRLKRGTSHDLQSLLRGGERVQRLNGARLCAKHQPQRKRSSQALGIVHALRLGLRPQPRSIQCAIIIHTPHAASRTPAALPTNNPLGATFSSSTNTAMMAIHQMFITPATNSSAIKNQQQPVQ